MPANQTFTESSGRSEYNASVANVSAPISIHRCTRKNPLVTSLDDVIAIATATPNVRRKRKSARRTVNTALSDLAVNQLHHFRPARQVRPKHTLHRRRHHAAAGFLY